MSKNWEGGSTRRWRKTRAQVLERDGYLCRAHPEGWCKQAGAKPHTCTVGAPLAGGHAHHTRGRQFGDDPAYLVAACPSCNLAIGEPVTLVDPPNRAVTQW